MNKQPRYNSKKRALLALLIACVVTLCACSGVAGAGNENTSGIAAVTNIAASDELDAIFAEKLPGPMLPPDEKPDEIICTDYTSLGLLRICYVNEKPDKKIKLEVSCGSNLIYYNLAANGGIEDFPLQYGDGEYMARIMEQIDGKEYYAAEYRTFDVMLDDEYRVYLNSVQNIDWDYDMEPIHDVRYIVADSLGESDALLPDCTDDIYNYVVDNIRYDADKVFDLLYDYLPDIVGTYTTSEGICYDYASLFAAMLRSVGIPTKLVKGYASYAPDTYHAWNEVYIEGEWITVDTTRDATLHSSGIHYDMRKAGEDYTTVYEY